MKVKENYISKRVLDNDIVMDITGNKKILLKLNETAAFMFDRLKKGISFDDLVHAVTENYDIDVDDASKDINEFVNKLKELDVLDD